MSNFEFKKSLGQNFLTDKNIVDKIVNSIQPKKEDLIIEIGPGAGALTRELIKKEANVLCFEIDQRLKEQLNKLENKKLNIVYEDFLKVNLKEYINKYNPKEIYVIGNLPYYITTAIINKIIEDKINVKTLVFMVQKEVGERFNAKPNTKLYNSLTVFLNYYFNISKIINVSKNCFIPKPKVDSVVIKFEKNLNTYDVINEDHLFKLIKASFRFKRKNLRNNLKEYNLENITNTLKKYNKDLTFRAENITLEEFIEISNNLN